MLKKSDIYRDSKNWYSGLDSSVASGELIKFCRSHAGKKILDLGCATGDYCLELGKLGYDCTGADVNADYVAAARKKSVNAVLLTGERLPFEDNSFDTVLLFEVLEHVPVPEALLLEARRVSAGNLLVTVPDCGSREMLRGCKLVCEHFLELDHVNFFTATDLGALLAAHFPKYSVERGEPILLWTVGLPVWIRRPVSALYRLGLFKAELFNRLYAVAEKK